MKRHDFEAIKDLTSIGRLLIALRIAQGPTLGDEKQRQLVSP